MKKITLLFVLAISTLANAQAPNWEWVKKICEGDPYSVAGRSTVDNEGNIVHAGNFSGESLQVSSEMISNPNPNNSKIYLTKRGPSGDLLWYKSNITTNQTPFVESYLSSLVTDEAGNIYITGGFRDYMTFDNITITNPGIYEYSMYVFKFDPNGNALWGKRAGGSGTINDFCRPVAIKANQNGDIFISGAFQNSLLDFGNGITLTGTGNNYKNDYVVKYNSLGTAVWAQQSQVFSEPITIQDAVVAVDNEYVYLSGCFASAPIYFGTTQLNSSGSFDIYLAKYSVLDGNLVFAKKIGTSGSQLVTDINVRNGNIFILGHFDSNFPLGPSNLSSAGSMDIFVAKLDSNGNPVWGTQAGGSNLDNATHLAVDSDENVYFSGSYQSGDMLIQGNIVSGSVEGETNSLIAKINGSGEFMWYMRPQGISAGIVDINILNDGNIITSGYYTSDIAFGNTAFNEANQANNKQFISKISQSQLGISDNYNSIVAIYPNPAKNLLNIDNYASLGQPYTITDMTGRTVKSGVIENAIDVSSLPSGIYALSINGITSKFIKE